MADATLLSDVADTRLPYIEILDQELFKAGAGGLLYVQEN